jgi:hypothetical protein
MVTISCVCCYGQVNYFEGAIVYSTLIRSKIQGLSDIDARRILAQGEVMTITYKNGYYKYVSSLSETYFNPKEKRAYYKFRKLDTLYYQDYSSDTTQLLSVLKNDSTTRINNSDCKSITLTTNSSTIKYVYSPTLQNDPIYGKNNTIDHFDVYTRETGGAVWLWFRAEFKIATLVDSCIRVEPKAIDDHFFDMPDLPVKKLEVSTLFSGPRFRGKDDAWHKYLQSNLDSKLSVKYINLPKGEPMAEQTALVSFMVSENGSVSNIQVMNRKEVHPKLAEEAVRVVRESTGWQPAMFYGEKMAFQCNQKITFQVAR